MQTQTTLTSSCRWSIKWSGSIVQRDCAINRLRKCNGLRVFYFGVGDSCDLLRTFRMMILWPQAQYLSFPTACH